MFIIIKLILVLTIDFSLFLWPELFNIISIVLGKIAFTLKLKIILSNILHINIFD